MRKDRNKKSFNTKAFAAAAILGGAAIAAASYAAYNRTMSGLTPTTSSESQNTWVFSAPESSPVDASKPGVQREETTTAVSEAEAAVIPT